VEFESHLEEKWLTLLDFNGLTFRELPAVIDRWRAGRSR
jgi:hypothetical protein